MIEKPLEKPSVIYKNASGGNVYGTTDAGQINSAVMPVIAFFEYTLGKDNPKYEMLSDYPDTYRFYHKLGGRYAFIARVYNYNAWQPIPLETPPDPNGSLMPVGNVITNITNEYVEIGLYASLSWSKVQIVFFNYGV